MKVVALLPMKANSERVPGKNFKQFGNKPLFMWVLKKLIDNKYIDQVIINTDARNIIYDHLTQKSKKITIRDRRAEICGDFVSMNTIIDDDIKNIDADIYIMTHTTNPFISDETISNALKVFKKALKKKSADSLFTVNKVQERFYDKDCSPINHDPNNLVRTQDLNVWFKENSNLYLFTKDSFMKTGARIGLNPIMYETPEYESTDIDTPADWDLVEVMIEYYKKEGLIK